MGDYRSSGRQGQPDRASGCAGSAKTCAPERAVACAGPSDT
ncbi:MAG: hypothetical protein HXX20_02865 [Chloroflexi bacterium]|nr:hypothetical protein [Chloroflexota bacterium]